MRRRKFLRAVIAGACQMVGTIAMTAVLQWHSVDAVLYVVWTT